MSIISLTTDFGVTDWFVGTMKAAILNVQPRAAVVDVTHDVSPGDLRAGAFALAAACRYFPRKTVHVAVVDPGVGSQRTAIAVETADYFFVGPDNGVLSLALKRETIKEIRALDEQKYFLSTVSQTFHGRDIFAPVAAHLSKGVPLKKLGSILGAHETLPWPEPKATQTGLRGEVVYIDRFGNVITNLAQDAIARFKTPPRIIVNGKRLCVLGRYYAAVPPGKPIAVIGSSGFLEIAVNNGSAADEYDLSIGDAIAVT